jgi:hypothetical protein
VIDAVADAFLACLIQMPREEAWWSASQSEKARGVANEWVGSAAAGDAWAGRAWFAGVGASARKTVVMHHSKTQPGCRAAAIV